MLKQVASRQSRGGQQGAEAVAWGRYGRQTVRNLVISCWRRWQNPSLWASRPSPHSLLSLFPFAFFVFWRTAEVWNIFRALFLLLVPSSNGIFSLERILLAFLQRNFHENFPHIVLQHLWGSLFSPPFCPLPLSLYKFSYKMFLEIEMLPGNLN